MTPFDSSSIFSSINLPLTTSWVQMLILLCTLGMGTINFLREARRLSEDKIRHLKTDIKLDQNHQDISEKIQSAVDGAERAYNEANQVNEKIKSIGDNFAAALTEAPIAPSVIHGKFDEMLQQLQPDPEGPPDSDAR